MKKLILLFLLTCFSFSLKAQTVLHSGVPLYLYNGYLGFGTSIPSSTLHLKDGTAEIRLLTGFNSSGYRLDIGVNDDGVNFSNNSNGRGYSFKNNAHDLLMIKHDGNVGIGITSPGYKLHVNGNSQIQSADDAPLKIVGTDTWSGIDFKDTDGQSYYGTKEPPTHSQ